MAILGDTKAVSLTLLDGIIGNLNPKTTNVYTLGTSSLKWNNIYTTETYIDKLTLPTTALNTPSLRWTNSSTEYSEIITTSTGILNLISKREVRLCPGNEINSTTPANSFQATQGVAVYTNAFIPIAAETMTLGSTDFSWTNVYSAQFNGLSLTPAATGFTIAGGTTSKTLTVSNTATIKSSTDTGTANYVAYYSTANNIKGHGVARFDDTAGTASVNGKNQLVLGNNIASGTAGNSYGILCLFTSSTGGTYIQAEADGSNWHEIILPKKNGTIALTSDLSSVSTTDEKVKVTARGTTKAYLLASTSATSNGTTAVAESDVYLGTTAGHLYATAVHNAVWNDYAEYRRTAEPLKPGNVIIDNDNGTVSLATQRLLPGAQVVSDTWGHIMGETDEAKTPVAVAGRVLVYTYQDRTNYHAGMAVCSAPNGTVDIMTREEIKEYPDCIIGYVSEIPNYETWGSGNVKVDGRIWVRVK